MKKYEHLNLFETHFIFFKQNIAMTIYPHTSCGSQKKQETIKMEEMRMHLCGSTGKVGLTD